MTPETATLERPAQDAEVLVSVENLRMHFPVYKGILRRQVGVIKAVDGISFDIRRGETLGLVGESGCGKTTVGRCILRLEKPTAGKVIFQGDDIAPMKMSEMTELRQAVQVIFQDPFSSLNPRMKIGSILSEPMRVHGIIKDASERRQRVSELLQLCGLNPRFADRYPHEMSGGQRQRVGIARALAAEPELLLLDEPMAGMNLEEKEDMCRFILDVNDEFGTTIALIEHDMAVVMDICDRVVVLDYGRKIADGSPDQVRADQDVIDAYLGVSHG